jgi:hypothetical protein
LAKIQRSVETASVKSLGGVGILKGLCLKVAVLKGVCHFIGGRSRPHCVRTAAVTTLCLTAMVANAGRPLATDDAATAGDGNCQIEVWRERSPQLRANVVAPACGLSASSEIGAEVVRGTIYGEPIRLAGLAWKWVPEQARIPLHGTALQMGLKLAGGWAKDQQRGWNTNTTDVLLLASLPISDTLATHANLGYQRDKSLNAGATLINVALTGSVNEHIDLFAETMWNSRRELFGERIYSAGGRWWLIKDTLGLDVTASRTSGARATTTWSLGFGWYGLRL